MVGRRGNTDGTTNSQQFVRAWDYVSHDENYISQNCEFVIANVADFGFDGKACKLSDSSGLAQTSHGTLDTPLRMILLNGPKRKMNGKPFSTHSALGPQKLSVLGQNLELSGDLFHPHFKVYGRHTPLVPKTLVMVDVECTLTACEVQPRSEREPYYILVFVSNPNHNLTPVAGEDVTETKVLRQLKSILEDGEARWPLKRPKLIQAVKESIARALALQFWDKVGAESTALHIRAQIQENFYDKSKDQQTAIERGMLAHLRDFQRNISLYHNSCNNFSRWLQAAGSPMSQVLQEQIGAVGERATRLEQRYREHLQLHVAAVSLEESRRAMDQNHSLGRLTQLAFVFIPVTFTTGVFGMNIRPFAKGGAPMWQFWVTSVTIAIGALLIWALASPLERIIPKIWARTKKPKEQPLSFAGRRRYTGTGLV